MAKSKQSWLKKYRIYIKILMMYLSSVAYLFSLCDWSPSHCSYVVKSIQVTIHLLLSQVTNQEKCDYKNIYNKMVTCISILVIDIYMLGFIIAFTKQFFFIVKTKNKTNSSLLLYYWKSNIFVSGKVLFITLATLQCMGTVARGLKPTVLFTD